jgi:sarcosine oxidase gamma subunit
VAELTPSDVAVVVCQAEAAALDALVLPGHRSRGIRTAPDEYLFLCEPAVVAEVAREASDRIAALDDDAVVLEVSDGWAGMRLTGADTAHAFSYVSALDLPAPDGFVQGDIANVAAKVLVDEVGLTILVPAYWQDHLHARLLHDAGAEDVRA